MPVGDLYRADLQGPRAAHDAGLNGHAGHHGQVRVHRRVGLLSKEVADESPDARDPGGAAHQHNLIHVLLLQVALREHRLHRGQDLLEQVLVQLLKKLSSDDGLEEDRSWSFWSCWSRSRTLLGLGGTAVGVEVERDADGGAGVQGEVDLGGLHRLSEAVDVFFQRGRHTKLLAHSLAGVLEQPLAEVLAAQLVVPCRGEAAQIDAPASGCMGPLQGKNPLTSVPF